MWNLPLCKLYKCFDLYLSHNSAVNPDGVFILELCLLRDDYFLIDNNDRGVCRISQGGGPTLKFLGIWLHMPRSGMSRAAKLRAFARGVWDAPTRKF